MPTGVHRVSRITLPSGVVVAGADCTKAWLKGGLSVSSRMTVADLKIGDRGVAGPTRLSLNRGRTRRGVGRTTPPRGFFGYTLLTMVKRTVAGLAAALCLLLGACAAGDEPEPATRSSPPPSVPSPADSPSADSPSADTPVFDVRAYGAAGDGRSDDAEALRAAARAAAAVGGIVYLPAGVYVVSGDGQFDLPDGASLRGDGPARTWLKGRLDFGSRSTIEGLKIGTRGLCAVRNRDAKDTTFSDCRFRGGGGEGDDAAVVMLGSSSSRDNGLRHVTFQRCDIERNLGVEDWSVNNGYGHGFNDITVHENPVAGGSHIAYLTFNACHIGVSNGADGASTGSPRAGIEVWTGRADQVDQGWEHLTLRACTFEATDRFTIDLADYETSTGRHLAGPALIEGNVIKGAGTGPGPHDWAYCICLEAPHDVTIRDNLIYRAHLTVICGSASPEGKTIMQDNVIDLTVSNGVTMNDDEVVTLKGGGGSFTGNVIRGGAGAGPFLLIKETSGQVVTGNRLYDLRSSGSPPMIVIRDASGNTVTGNLLWSAGPSPPTISSEGSSRDNVLEPNRLRHR